MTDPKLRAAVEAFLADYDRAMDEYEQGYVDADATLTAIDSHATELRRAVEAAEEPDSAAEPETRE